MARIRQRRDQREKRKHLEFHRGKWRVSVAVPRALQGILGTRLKHPLGTDSLTLANVLKPPHVEKFKRQIRDASAKAQHSPIVAEALAMAEARRLTETEHERDQLDDAIVDRAYEILGRPIAETPEEAEPYKYDPKREREAAAYVDLAKGTTVPLTLHHEAYLKQQHIKIRTQADDVRAVRFLEQWCGKNGIAATVQAISKRRAVTFLDGLSELAGGVSGVTIKKYRNRLSRYWQWLETREYASSNVWRDLKVSTPQVLDHERERPFTREEMLRLLDGPAREAMHDLMCIAALSGARLDAIVDLKVQDCEGGAFRFKPQKKETAYRFVPIHSALRKIIERRAKGKAPSADLFPEWPPPRKAGSQRERSFKASNAFTAYRRLVGVDAVLPGRRRALTNFHSFRRWFITEAERAGSPRTSSPQWWATSARA